MFDLQGLNIYLIGMMGSGKSTLGNLLAQKLDYGFIDTDTTIEKIVDQSVIELFQIIGESKFRQIETQVLTEVSAYTRLVIATGDGIASKRENWGHLQQGLTIWLDPMIEILADTNQDLPSTLQQLSTQQRDRYAEADIHIPITTPLSPPEIIEQIITTIPTVLKRSAN